jgi:Lon protease-like protein
MTGEVIYNVPIFPLHKVLFPSLPLTLHIFEERYRVMIEDLRRGDGRFCVALIREGQEVGGPAEPYNVACLAELVQVEPTPDGRYMITAVGVERVKIVATERLNKPYLTGSLEVWSDEEDGDNPGSVEKAAELFAQYARIMLRLSGSEEEQIPMPGDADLLSYVIGTGLQTDALTQQRLLEIPGPAARLRAETEMLQNELPLLRAFASAPQPPSVGFGQFSAN